MMKKIILMTSHLLLFTYCHAQWVKLSTDTVHYYSSVHFLNSDTGFVTGLDWYNPNFVGIILSTVDGGDNWDTTRIDPGFWFMSVQFINDTMGFTVGQDGGIYKTINTGNSWFYNGDCLWPADVGQFWFINTDTAFFENFGGMMLRSNSWSIDSTCFPTSYIGFGGSFPGTGALRFIDAQNGYIAGGNGHFSRTNDGGNTWVPFNTDSTINILSAWMTDSNHAVITGRNGKVSVSKNGGIIWSPTQSISAHPIMDVMMKDTLFGYAVGGADKYYNPVANSAPTGIIWKTMDGGDSWIVEDSSWFDQLTSVAIVNDSLAFAVGYRGLILRNSNFLSSVSVTTDNQPVYAELYPNPFSDYLTISVPSREPVEFSLFDITFKQQLTLFFQSEITIPTGELKAGIYFCELRSGSRLMERGRVIKIDR